jgi:serine/threonine protein kinase
MEFCSGGDLFSYIEKRGFRLPEQRAAQLIHKLSASIYYLHSYGIAHRDLKPENVLMTDNTDEADIRLLDFGLSKIIGPNEYCTEPFGTLVIYYINIFSLMLLLKYYLRSLIIKALIYGVLELLPIYYFVVVFLMMMKTVKEK